MGKGDKKTKRGKIIMGSYGVRRPKRQKSNPAPEIESSDVKAKEEKIAKDETIKEKKKPTAKKVVEEKKEEATVPKKKTAHKSVEKETEGHEEEKKK